MDIVRVIGIALLTTFAALILKQNRPELAAIVSLTGGLVILLMFTQGLSSVINNLTQIVQRTGIRSDVFVALLRIIGIGYLTEFAAGICQDADNNSMAQKVTLAGKVLILILAIPIINNLIEVVLGVVGG